MENAAKFFGSTPPVSPRAATLEKGRTNEYRPNDFPFSDKNSANFYGAPMPSKSEPNLGHKELSAKDFANFYGATPPQTHTNFYGGHAKPGQNLRAEYRNPIAHYEQTVSKKDAANFYGVTPPQSRLAYGASRSPVPLYKELPPKPAHRNPITGSPTRHQPEPPPRAVANFYGATPPMSKQSPIPTKEFANFYGATPPPTGNKPSGFGPSQSYNTNAYQNVLNPNPQYPYSNVKTDVYQNSPNINTKNLANFYGVTPPPTGMGGQNDGFSKNALKFFGDDGVDPEFQYAADIVKKGTGGYQQYPGKLQSPPPGLPQNGRSAQNLVSTAKRIFN